MILEQHNFKGNPEKVSISIDFESRNMKEIKKTFKTLTDSEQNAFYQKVHNKIDTILSNMSTNANFTYTHKIILFNYEFNVEFKGMYFFNVVNSDFYDLEIFVTIISIRNNT